VGTLKSRVDMHERKWPIIFGSELARDPQLAWLGSRKVSEHLADFFSATRFLL
jgi:hypothetical protein